MCSAHARMRACVSTYVCACLEAGALCGVMRIRVEREGVFHQPTSIQPTTNQPLGALQDVQGAGSQAVGIGLYTHRHSSGGGGTERCSAAGVYTPIR